MILTKSTKMNAQEYEINQSTGNQGQELTLVFNPISVHTLCSSMAFIHFCLSSSSLALRYQTLSLTPTSNRQSSNWWGYKQKYSSIISLLIMVSLPETQSWELSPAFCKIPAIVVSIYSWKLLIIKYYAIKRAKYF